MELSLAMSWIILLPLIACMATLALTSALGRRAFSPVGATFQGSVPSFRGNAMGSVLVQKNHAISAQDEMSPERFLSYDY